MAFATLYRFRIELSDVDRGVYEALDFRAALHPSEITLYLVTRVLAYALNFQEGLEFSAGGLSDPEAPGLKIEDPQGGANLWIEIGNPNPRKLHKAHKISREVKVYTYKDPKLLVTDMTNERVHEAHRIPIYSFDKGFIEALSQTLEKDNRWSLLHNEGRLTVSLSDGRVLESDLHLHRVSEN